MHLAALAARLCLTLALCSAIPARAAEGGDALRVDLELVIAVDVSASMDREEFLLQRQGYIAAISHPEFFRAISAGAHRRIALAYVEWSGELAQRIVVPWRLIDSAAAAASFAAELDRTPLILSRGTSISAALAFSAGLFDGNGFDAPRRVVDISGDGPNNYGPPVPAARDAAVRAGIVVNGLPIMLRPSPVFPEMDRYYTDCVIGGAGAFVMPVKSVEEFAVATRQKLILEVAGLSPTAIIPAALPEPVDCLVGEAFRKRYSDPYLPGLDN
jgi:hypothetical protein